MHFLHLNVYTNDELNEIHALLIHDPVFDCIERESYTDEYGYLYESG